MPNIMKILQGQPGSGKTSYISKQTASENWPRYAMICSISQYTDEVLSTNLPHLYNIAPEALCFRRALYLVMSQAPFIIIDNSNLDVEDVAPYVLLAKAYSYDFEIINIDILNRFDG